MTNNDELALKLKEAAESATKGSWRRTSTEFNGICVGPFSFTKEEVLARTVEKRDAIFISVANPANILALLAERDADKKLIALNTEMFRNADRDIAALRQRIAELEARTGSVKLRAPGIIKSPMGVKCEVWERAEVEYALDAAGIKLEVGE